MEGHRNGQPVDDANLTDVLWRQMQSVADALVERRFLVERKRPAADIREGINLFIVDLIGHWIDRLAREPDAGRRRELERLLRVVGAESPESCVDMTDQKRSRVSA
jgi:hypothetical protein